MNARVAGAAHYILFHAPVIRLRKRGQPAGHSAIRITSILSSQQSERRSAVVEDLFALISAGDHSHVGIDPGPGKTGEHPFRAGTKTGGPG